MNALLTRQWERMREGKERTIERVGRMTPTDQARRPADAGWSAIEVVEHLVLVEEGVVSALAKEPNPDRPRVLGKGGRVPFWVVRAFLLTGIRRIKVPVEIVVPKGGVAWEPIIARWEGERRKLEHWLGEASPEVLRAPRFRHPIGGWLDVRGALTFTADHLVNHLRQIGRIEGSLRRGPG